MNKEEKGMEGHDRLSGILTLLTALLLCTTSLAGVLSLNFTHSYPIVNMYGHSVEMYGYGIYAYDTYFFAPVFIGSDICILCVVIPMFIRSYGSYRRGKCGMGGLSRYEDGGSSAAEKTGAGDAPSGNSAEAVYRRGDHDDSSDLVPDGFRCTGASSCAAE